MVQRRRAVSGAFVALGLLIALAIAVPRESAAQTPTATPTPGGDCCIAHGGPGCDVASCSDCVCNGTVNPDRPCCDSAGPGWDQFCVADAGRCGDLCPCSNQTPVPTPTAGGPCCDTHEGPGCDNSDCQACVCGEDGHCCGVGFTCTPEGLCWDASCTAEAEMDPCASSCGCSTPTPTPVPTPGGDCCAGHAGPSCDDATCASCVCAGTVNDSECCSGVWDSTCANEASNECSASCPSCPGTGDCCSTHDGPGCDETTCKECVCNGAANDAACCSADAGWDGDCVLDVNNDCAASCTCVPKGPCCDAHSDGTVGCGENSCEICVCRPDLDPFCCDQVGGGFWDGNCAQEAADPDLCQDSCTGCVDCCSTHDAPGCSHDACQMCVCGTLGDGACCSGVWDQTCVDETSTPECANACVCGVTTRPSPCPGDCGGDGEVSINELIVAVNIVLGTAPLSSCTAIDTNGDQTATVAELIQAVNAALNGCP